MTLLLTALALASAPASAGIEAGLFGGYANTGYFGGNIPRMHGMSASARVGWALNDDFVPELVVSHNRGAEGRVEVTSTPVMAGGRFRVLDGDARPFLATHVGVGTEWFGGGGLTYGETALFWDMLAGLEMSSDSGVYIDIYAGHTLAAVNYTSSIVQAGLGAGYKF